MIMFGWTLYDRGLLMDASLEESHWHGLMNMFGWILYDRGLVMDACLEESHWLPVLWLLVSRAACAF